MNRNWRWVALFCAVIVLSALFSAVRRGRINTFLPEVVTIEEEGFSPRQLPTSGDNPARHFSDAIADAVEKVMPSVVVIRTRAFQDMIQRDLFGFPLYKVRQQLLDQGSGVVIDERGYVLTSHHVVAGAEDHIEVVLSDGTKLPATVVGCDRITDVAVLRITAPEMDFRPVEFGDSDAVRVGEVAIAIGSPFSLQSSVTVGHVSQKGRRMQVLPYEDFIQTDAAINEGNSGGPLIDVDGRLIGINAAIKTDAAARGVGIAFAIPSNLAMVIAKSLIETGKHEWPWVGAAFGKTGTRAVVEQVWRETPAAEVGMLPGDTILEVDGKTVKDQFDIYRIIFNHAVGETLRFSVQRGEETMLEFDLLLQEFPEQP